MNRQLEQIANVADVANSLSEEWQRLHPEMFQPRDVRMAQEQIACMAKIMTTLSKQLTAVAIDQQIRECELRHRDSSGSAVTVAFAAFLLGVIAGYIVGLFR